MHLDIPLLSNAKCSVGSLVLHCRVPPAVEMEHVVGCRQIEANATSLKREDEDRRATALLLKTLYHHITLLLRGATVQKEHLAPQRFLEIMA